MTRELTLLVSLIVVSAGWALVHLRLLVRALRAPRLARGLKLLAWFPPATPIVGWLGGARVMSALWAALALVYAWLRGLV